MRGWRRKARWRRSRSTCSAAAASRSLAAAVAALALYYFINQLVGHVRFLPLLAGLVCLYAIGKELHLSPLIIVLVCGLLHQQSAPAQVAREVARVA